MARGDDATAVEIVGVTGDYFNADWTAVVSGLDITTGGARSSGLIMGGVDGLLDGSTIFRGVFDVDIVTAGEAARGMVLGGLGEMNESSNETRIENVTIATSGADAHGLVLGAGGETLATDIAIATTGDNAIGFLSQGGQPPSTFST